MNWWCAAQGTAWEWTWRPYVGVWLLVIGLVAVRSWAARRWAPAEHGRHGSTGLFLLGAVTLWIAADWPIGPLGAGYLLSVHTAQYILFAFVVPPLLIQGTPKQVLARLTEPSWVFRVAWFVSRPLVAFAIFNVVMLATHLPAVVDGLTRSQLGSFAVDMSWLLSGLVFWWPIIGPLEKFQPLPYPGRMVYLIANVFIPTVPAAFLTYARYPIYALYELAPPVGTMSTVEDQQLAGMIMKIVGGFIVFGTASVLFFRWSRSEAD